VAVGVEQGHARKIVRENGYYGFKGPEICKRFSDRYWYSGGLYRLDEL
jgi:hypothetical protein